MEQFYNTIQRAFRLQRLEKEVSDRNPLFIFDDKKANRTFMIEKRKGNSLIVRNINKNKVHHICVDGVLIAPNSAYPDGVKDRLRNDCMLFTSSKLAMIELKLELSSTKKDTIKDELEKALHQIDTFYQYLNDSFDGSLMQNFTNKKNDSHSSNPQPASDKLPFNDRIHKKRNQGQKPQYIQQIRSELLSWRI